MTKAWTIRPPLSPITAAELTLLTKEQVVYPQAFLDAIDVLIGPGPGPGGDEGGYGNDPADPGGETNWGIDKATHPHLDIRHLTRDDAVMIYYAEWWVNHDLGRYPPLVGAKLFNVAVNTGWAQAVRIAQRAAGVTPDGVVGPRTLAAIDGADAGLLLNGVRVHQAAFYQRLADGRATLAKFLDGWLRRATE